MNTTKPLACLLASITATMFVGCNTPYRSTGPNQQWLFAQAGDEESKERAKSVRKQRSWGWDSHFAEYEQDGSLRLFAVGPIAYAGENETSIDISCVIFANPPVRGRLIFEATAQKGYQLSEEWAKERTYEIEMEKTYQFGEVTVPQFRVPTESIRVRWVTDGVVSVQPEE